MLIRKYIFLGFLCFLIFKAAAQNPIQTAELKDFLLINEDTKVYVTTDTLSGGKALQKIDLNQLSQVAEKVNPGITNAAYWISFQITNDHIETDVYYLEVDYAQLDYLQLYEIKDKEALLIAETGDRFLFESRPVQYRNFVFPIAIDRGETSKFLLNIDKRRSASRFPLLLYSEISFWKMYNRETIFYGFCFGFLALVTLISLLIGLRLKQGIFIWYSLYVLTFGMRCFAKLGYGYQYVMSNFPELNTHFFPMTTQLAMVFLIIYIQKYFDTRHTLPRFNRIMIGILLLIFISTVAWIIFPSFIINAAPVLISIRYVVMVTVIAFAYTSAITHLKTDRFRARTFLLGYTIFFLGVISQILMEYGAIDASLVPGDPLFAGFFVEIGVLSYAMIIVMLQIVSDRNQLKVSNRMLNDKLEKLKQESQELGNPYVILKSKAVVDHHKIRYIQSDDHYLEFYLDDKARPEIDRNKLSAILEVLPPQFVQIHRSTIVNLEYVRTVYGSYLLLRDGEELKLSRTYKPHLEERLMK